MKRVVEKTSKIAAETASQVTRAEVMQTTHKRPYATLSAGYLENSSVANTQKHPQVLQKKLSGEIIAENKRAGLTHSEKLNPQHEKKLPPVLQKYSIGPDAKQQKEQFCYHFDRSYTPTELAQYKENPEITTYLNDNKGISDTIRWNFALLRGREHQKEMERFVPESDKKFADLEESLKNN